MGDAHSHAGGKTQDQRYTSQPCPAKSCHVRNFDPSDIGAAMGATETYARRRSALVEDRDLIGGPTPLTNGRVAETLNVPDSVLFGGGGGSGAGSTDLRCLRTLRAGLDLEFYRLPFL